MAAKSLVLSIGLLALTATAHPQAEVAPGPAASIQNLDNLASNADLKHPLTGYSQDVQKVCNNDPARAATRDAVEAMKAKINAPGWVAIAKFGKACTEQPDLTTPKGRLMICAPKMDIGKNDVVMMEGPDVTQGIVALEACPDSQDYVGGIIHIGGIGNYMSLDIPSAPGPGQR